MYVKSVKDPYCVCSTQKSATVKQDVKSSVHADVLGMKVCPWPGDFLDHN